MTLPPFITADQVAQIIGLDDGAAFLRQRLRLQLETLFPLPLPVQKRPMRWKRDEVQAWLDRQGLPVPPAPPVPVASNVVLLAHARKG